MSELSILTPEVITSKFPPIQIRIIGEPDLPKLFTSLLHIRACASTSSTRLCAANFKFLVDTIDVFQRYTNAMYPDEEQDYPQQPTAPDYTNTIDAAERATVKNEWARRTKNSEDCKNMNQALVERFKLLLDQTYVDAYNAYCLTTDEQNPTFLHCMDYFLNEYGDSDAADRETNIERMKQPWNPAVDGFEALVLQIANGIDYSIYAGGNVDDGMAVDMAENNIRKCGQYTDILEKWMEEPPNQRTWNNFVTFWREKLRLRKRLKKGTAAAQMGYGMSATGYNDDEESTKAFEESVANFGAAHAANSTTISNLSDTKDAVGTMATQIGQLSQQVQMLALSVQQPRPPTVMYQQPIMPQQQQQYPQQQGQKKGKKWNNNNNNNNNQFVNGYNQAATQLGTQTFGRQQTTPNPIKRFENWNYCHTHGGDVPDYHQSCNCPKPGPNHRPDANRQNWQMLGGNPKAMHKTMLPSQAGRTPATTKYQRQLDAQRQQQQQPPAQGYAAPMQQVPSMPMHMQQAPAMPMHIPMQPQMPMQSMQAPMGMYMQPGAGVMRQF